MGNLFHGARVACGLCAFHSYETDSMFHLNFVPEGNYLLRVTHARDIDHSPPPPRPPAKEQPDAGEAKEIVVRKYPDYEVPLDVTSDVSDLTLTIPSKEK